MGDPIPLETNDQWVNRQTRGACKYSPVVVSKTPGELAVASMIQVLAIRVKLCQEMGLNGDPQCAWFSFKRLGPTHEPSLRPSSVPVIVISGGSAKKLAHDLNKDYSLAWHPMNVRNQPIYLLVHTLDFKTYARALADIMGRFRNMHLIGWDGGGMSGFGAARVAALTFADNLPYRPQRILMMDQDVIKTEATRLDQPGMTKKVERLHTKTDKPIIGYGVGYPERVPVPKFEEQFGFKAKQKAGVADAAKAGVAEPAKASAASPLLKPAAAGQEARAPVPMPNKPAPDDSKSPSQQFVSIKAPFRDPKKSTDGIYPAYMVAGGEDMLMSLQQGLMDKEDRNVTLLNEKILKRDLGDPKNKALQDKLQDKPNAYWNKKRLETLGKLYDVERNTPVIFNRGRPMTLAELMDEFRAKGWINPDEAEAWNVSACIIERIILRLYKLGKFPKDLDTTVFNKPQLRPKKAM